MADPELQPPFVHVPGLSNFRDIGGLPITDDNGTQVATVRKGIFYRGPDTRTVLPEGIAKLRELRVTTDFDLRSKGQIEKLGGPNDMEGIQRLWCPAFPDEEYSPEKAAARYLQYSSDGTEGIVDAFFDILTYGASACRTILLHVAAMSPSSPTACYIHCTTGNNRSGVFIGIILSLLGVKPEEVAKEYSLSEIGLKPSREAAVTRLMKSPVFSSNPDGGRARAERMVGARQESMLAMLEMVHRKWGGAEGYVKYACKLTDEQIEKVRKVLVRPEQRPGHVRRISDFLAWTWNHLIE